MDIFQVIKKIICLSIVVPLAASLQSCDNDLFIDRDDVSVAVSEPLLDFTGGKSVVKFSKVLVTEGIPYVSVYWNSPDGIGRIDMPEFKDGRYVFDDDLFSMTATYDEKKREMQLDLSYSLIADTVGIYVSREYAGVWIKDVVKVRPATPSQLKSIEYWPSSDWDKHSSSETVTIQYVNSTDAPEDRHLFSPYITAPRGWFRPDRLEVMDIFGGNPPKVPVVVRKDGQDVDSDARIPFSMMSSIINDGYLVPDEPIVVTVPPHSLCEIKMTVYFMTYSIFYSATFENPDVEGSEVWGGGQYFLQQPESYYMSVRSYDLETGDEI